MPKRKQPSLPIKVWRIIIGAIDYFLVALVPPIIAIIGFLLGNQNAISNVPLWIWIAITLTLFILAFSKGLQRYNEDMKKAGEYKSYSRRESAKVKSNMQSGGITADTVNIFPSSKNTAEDLPIIVPDKDGFDKLEPAFPLWNQGSPSSNKVKRYHLVLRNIGRVDTTPVHPTISFYTMRCKELTALSHEKAFWFNDKPRIQRSGNEVHILRSSQSPEGISLIIQNEGDENLYVFSDDSYLPGTLNIHFNEALKIPTDKIYIHVKLTAQNLNMDPIWVKITNRRDGKPPKFEILNAHHVS
ncbi:MAG TPA: hypothetical protein VN843_04270 [Anaerolineales bacterium]|nr:hypothetical protein [Anaerolineales bacterium]